MDKKNIAVLILLMIFCASTLSFAAKKAPKTVSKIKPAKQTVIQADPKADPPGVPFYLQGSGPFISWETPAKNPSKGK